MNKKFTQKFVRRNFILFCCVFFSNDALIRLKCSLIELNIYFNPHHSLVQKVNAHEAACLLRWSMIPFLHALCDGQEFVFVVEMNAHGSECLWLRSTTDNCLDVRQVSMCMLCVFPIMPYSIVVTRSAWASSIFIWLPVYFP